jgi:uncharacterized cupin superfamily protein
VTAAKSPLLSSAAIERLPEQTHVHQFNDNAVRMTRSLGDAAGMHKIGVHFVRLLPGRESTQYHFHHCDEEFIYILAGTGTARIGDAETPVGTGDFMGFTAPSAPHSLINNSAADLIYLMGGQRNPIDICDYPDIERRMIRQDGLKFYADWEDIHDVTITDPPTSRPTTPDHA